MDPVKLIENNGDVYGRSTSDDGRTAAAYVADMIRYKQGLQAGSRHHPGAGNRRGDSGRRLTRIHGC